MSDYEEDHFDPEDQQDNKQHLLKLSIDFLNVKDCKLSANLFLQYTLKLQQTHSFKSNPPTPVNQS